ncbi:MAG: magnesium transporter [Bacteriovoracaceae bacterium]|nr:magnesium transporter [Bacteriovoracaceae bacterium]
MIELDTLTENQNNLCIDLIEKKQYSEFLREIETMPYADVAEVIEESDDVTEVMKIILADSDSKAGRITSYLSEADQLELFDNLPTESFAKLFANMEPDIRVDLFQLIPEDERKQFLRFLDHKTVGNLFLLDSYDPDSAGGIMSTEFEAVCIGMTVEEVITELKDIEHRTHNLFYIFVIDDDKVLKGRVSIRELLFADKDEIIGDIVKDIIAAAHVDEDQEDVAKKFEKYDLYNIPVINGKNQLVGLINSDDILDVIREEETEDMEKLMGISQGDHELSYLESSIFSHFKKRVIWLIGLTILGVVSGLVIQEFEETLHKYVVLAFFMPLIAATGGNVGSQAASVIIRALALDEISIDEWFEIIFKELRIALMIAVSLGILAFFGVSLIGQNMTTADGPSIYLIAQTIGVALSLQVISAIMFGTCFPLIVKFFKGDPALVASPAITTFVDITGLIIYFTTATVMLIG